VKSSWLYFKGSNGHGGVGDRVAGWCGGLVETVRAAGLDRGLFLAWRKFLARHDPGKIVTDLARRC
jgi:hypothetical protein